MTTCPWPRPARSSTKSVDSEGWEGRSRNSSFPSILTGEGLIYDAFAALLLFPVRYFKQIAKSVRANGSASSGSEENADDFLGCINIPLNVSVTK